VHPGEVDLYGLADDEMESHKFHTAV